MYKPIIRPTKTNIRRTRTGCHTCRRRKTKCDETKPACNRCTKIGLKCEGYGINYVFMNSTVAPEENQLSIDSDVSKSVEEYFQLQAQPLDSNTAEDVDRSTSQHEHGSTTSHSSSLLDGLYPHTQEDTSWTSDEDMDLEVSQFLELEYLSHWTNVLDKLPPVFRDIPNELGDPPVLRSARLSLSARNLSFFQLFAETGKGQTGAYTLYKSHPEHQRSDRIYYNIAIRHFMQAMESKSDPILLLSSLLLFGFIELDSGSFVRFQYHLNAMGQLVSNDCQAIAKTPFGVQLLSVWLSLRAMGNYMRLPFIIERFWYGLDAITAPLDVSSLLNTYEAQNTMILILISEARRLSDFELVKACVAVAQDENPISKCLDVHFEQLGRPYSPKSSHKRTLRPDEDHLVELYDLSRRLDRWHKQLKLSDLPIETGYSLHSNPIQQIADTLSIAPLKFHTHQQAMDYAYYACCRLSVSRTNPMVSPTPSNLQLDQVNQWAMLILRIIAGLELKECMKRNGYFQSATDLLLCCAQSCKNRGVLTWIENWFKEIYSISVFGEYNSRMSPLTELQILREQLLLGRDVWMLAKDAGFGKLEYSDTMNAECLSYPAVLYGRNLNTGTWFYDNIFIHETLIGHVLDDVDHSSSQHPLLAEMSKD